MLLGLLADIHEAVEPLREALARFRELGVEEVIHLGDVCRMHRRLDETCRVLAEAGVEGVWGNHDLGLCRAADEEVRRKFTPGVLDCMGRLQPHLVREDCLLSHVEPWLDANDIFQLWYFDGLPDTPQKLARCFDAVPQRVLFSGHNHRWFLATPEGPCEWQGECAIRLAPPVRYLLILHAVVLGHCATYDTATHLFTPIRLASAGTSGP
jgi:predicted phosphodiesterase